jgi:hypothetical protein
MSGISFPAPVRAMAPLARSGLAGEDFPLTYEKSREPGRVGGRTTPPRQNWLWAFQRQPGFVVNCVARAATVACDALASPAMNYQLAQATH